MIYIEKEIMAEDLIQISVILNFEDCLKRWLKIEANQNKIGKVKEYTIK